MKKYGWLIFTFFIAITANAQQNLFNIPSGDITPRNKWFYQKQTNFYQPWELEMKHHFVYGLPGDFEVGVNVVNLPFNFRHRSIMPFNLHPDSTNAPLSPLVLFTTQKLIRISDRAQFNVGTQMGFNISDRVESMRYAHLSYAMFCWKPFPWMKLLSGVYVTTRYKAGEGTLVGILGGFELNLHPKWILMGDFMTGTHGLGGSVWGATYNVTDRFQLCLGGLVPNPDSMSKPALVLEVNLLGFAMDHDGTLFKSKRKRLH